MYMYATTSDFAEAVLIKDGAVQAYIKLIVRNFCPLDI